MVWESGQKSNKNLQKVGFLNDILMLKKSIKGSKQQIIRQNVKEINCKRCFMVGIYLSTDFERKWEEIKGKIDNKAFN